MTPGRRNSFFGIHDDGCTTRLKDLSILPDRIDVRNNVLQIGGGSGHYFASRRVEGKTGIDSNLHGPAVVGEIIIHAYGSAYDSDRTVSSDLVLGAFDSRDAIGQADLELGRIGQFSLRANDAS